MLIITDLNGNSEALTNYKDVEINEEVNGDFSLSFTSFLTEKNAHSFPLLQEKSIVSLEDGQEFRVNKFDESRNIKSGSYQHVFFDLIGHRLYETIGGTKSISDVFTYILNGTGWTFENIDVDNYQLLTDFGNGNAVALIRYACSIFNCEIKIEAGKHIKIYKEIGKDNDEQFRYKYNIKTLKRTVDTTNLSTIIKGYGGNGLEIIYRSPMADIYGEIHAEPITDDKITTVETMTERLKQELNDVPEVTIELEMSQLGFNVGLGDKVWLIHEPLGIEFQTRVMALKTYPFKKKSPVVTLSNKKQTFSDSLTQTKIEIKENQKETRSKFEQTNEKITLEVERIDDSISTIAQTADSIELRVSTVEGDVSSISQTVNTINLTVSDLNSEIGDVKSELSIQAGQISSKVSSDDFNGETIASLINQTPSTITLNADKIDLLGITKVADTLWLGDDYNQTRKTLNFKSSASIYTPDYSDNLVIDTMGVLYLDPALGVRIGDPDYSSVPIVKSYQSHQDISLELSSTGSLIVRLSNGKTASFTPTSWTG